MRMGNMRMGDLCSFPMLLAILLATVGAVSSAQEKKKVLPEGDGLAAKYPGDRGIETDKDVLFADDFEGGTLEKWDADQSEGDTTRVAVTSDAELAFYGDHACRVTATRGRNNGGGLIKWFGEGHDEMYARFYVKFAEDAGYTHHFVRINGSPDRWGSFGKAGIRPKGDDFLSTGIEPWFDWGRNAPPGKWMFYTYWHEMKASQSGMYWGNAFHPESDPIARGKWICMEIRVKMNTPGEHDGEQSVWQDGKLIGDFTGINWRTSAVLKANVFKLMSYVTEKVFGYTEQHAGNHEVHANTTTNTVWFDQVVVATEHIGPLRNPNDD